MKRMRIASIIVCAALAAQSNGLIANAEYRPYSPGQYEAAQTVAVTHEQKKTILAAKGLISEAITADETKPVIYEEAANTCVTMKIQLEERENK